MANSNNSIDQLIAQAKLGEEAALADLLVQVGPRLRRAVDVELEAVQHNLDATQMWNEIQAEAKRRVGEFQGTTEAEFEAWAERLALRHIRYSVGGRANVETIVSTPHADTLRKPTQSSEVSETLEVSNSKPTRSTGFDPQATVASDNDTTAEFDPNATLGPDDAVTANFDPHGTISPDHRETAKFDPNATLAPGADDTIGPDAFAIPKRDPHATITDLSSVPLAPQTTKIFGDYEILQTIAKGGMGVVYKARQRKLNRIVALKMILAGQFADEGDIERFYVEAEAAAQLRHPNIVGIFEVGECEGQHYFSMEYIEGKSLGDLVREHPLAPPDAARFVKAISEAMHYAHEKGVLHRDLKPSNVLVDNNDEPLITDFGLAKRTEEQSMRTAAGSILGTPSYMPPEQASGKLDLISERSDVYSIGAILYELITGKPPFGAANPWETIKQVISDEPVSPRVLNNSVPVDLETICLKCLQKDQARRYNSAQDLADELQRFLAGEPILARPISVVERSLRWCYRNPWPTAALGVLLLGVVGTSVGLKVAIDARAVAEYERGNAVVAKEAAEASEVKAVLAKNQAEMSRDQLMTAINELFTAWGDVTLLNTPGFEDVRAKLLATAKNLYERMGKELGADPKIQEGLGEAYFRLGRLMFNLESFADASKSLKSGLDIQEHLHTEDPGDETRLHALGESRNLYGNVLEITAVADNRVLEAARTGLVDAEAYYGKAIESRRELAARFPDKLEYERQLLNSQMNQAMIQQRIGRLLDDYDQSTEAEPFYVAARSGVEAVQKGRNELLARRVEKSDLQLDLIHDFAQGYYNLAKVTMRLGDYAATDKHLAAAIHEFDTLLKALPKTLEYQYSKANCWLLVGEAKFEQLLALEDGNPAKKTLAGEAIAAYKNEEEVLKELAIKSPLVPKYRRDLAQAYFRIGEIHFTVEEDKDALAAYESAAATLTRMVEDFSVDGDRLELVRVYFQIGEIQFLVQQYDQALAAYQSAETTLTPLLARFPRDEYLADLSEQAKSHIAEVQRYTKPAADASPPTPSESPPTGPEAAN